MYGRDRQGDGNCQPAGVVFRILLLSKRDTHRGGRPETYLRTDRVIILPHRVSVYNASTVSTEKSHNIILVVSSPANNIRII